MINKLSKQVHANAVSKGFYEGGEKNMGEILCLIHGEVSEALEADREGRMCMADVSEIDDVKTDAFKELYEHHVKGTFDEELADIVIRVMDLAAYKGIDLENHIRAKMRYNSMRPHKHGKKY